MTIHSRLVVSSVTLDNGRNLDVVLEAEPTGTAIFLTWPSFRSAILVMHWRLLWRSCSDIRSATISVREPINLDEGGIGQVEMLDQVSMAFLAPLHRLHSDAVAVI